MAGILDGAVSDVSKEGLEATVALINAGVGQSIAIAGDVAAAPYT